MSAAPDLFTSLLDKTPWKNEGDSILLTSSLVLRRNLAHYPFPNKFHNHESNQILQGLKPSVLSLTELEEPQFFLEKDLTMAQKDFLFEHFLLLQNLLASNGAGVIFDKKGNFLALLNSEDHLDLHFIYPENDEKGWNFLSQIETHLEAKQEFAFSQKFGYLTASPSSCGTGLSLYVFLHIPGIVHTDQLENILTNCQDEEIHFLSLSGTLEEMIGDILIIENTFTLGVSEEAILRAVQTAATKIISAEKTVRSHLKQEPNAEIKDLISKGFGLLLHSYQLDAKDAINLLSIAKLGRSLGYLTGTDESVINTLMFQCRRGHLCQQFPQLKDTKEIAHKRAEFIHEKLKGIQLSPELQ